MIKISNIAIVALAAFSITACSATKSSKKNTVPVRNEISQTPKDPKALAAAINGEWIVTAIGNEAVTAEEDIPYINFVPAEKRFYASNGCNVLNGEFQLTSAGMLTFSKVASTMMYCADAPYEAKINKVIADGRPVSVKFQTIGNATFMYLLANGQVELTLRRANMEYLNGKWEITDIRGKSVDDPEANIFFDVTGGKIHGNTGCNYFNGDINFNPEVDNSINFSGMQVTRMACPKADQERNILVGLEETARVVRSKGDVIKLVDAQSHHIMTLHKVANTD